LLVHRIVLFTARPLVMAVLAVVASFIFALWLSQHRLNDVETNVYEVAANAEPSVVHLENARTELGQTGLYVDECVAALADHLPTRCSIGSNAASRRGTTRAWAWVSSSRARSCRRWGARSS
jgi:hypothetical protein